MSRLVLLPLLSLVACADDGAIVGPFTGETHRFVVDRFELPMSLEAARESANDLDGNDGVDNLIGISVRTLQTYGQDSQTHVNEIIAAGALVSTIEIQADDLRDDPSVGVTFYGREGAPARVVGGAFVDGVFHPNRIAIVDGMNTGKATLVLPAFGDADPMELDAVTFEIELVPDADGYTARIAGAVRTPQLLGQVREAIRAQIANHPETHRSMWTIADKNLDGDVTPAEVEDSLLRTLLAPDVELSIDGAKELVASFGFELHAKPCASGRCGDSTVATCFDRVRNGDETDVDCGGSCGLACAGGLACGSAGDCQSRTCDAGTCAAVSCTDGVKNGLEASLDCGGACSTKCERGEVCGYGFDCASGACSATSSTGTCR